MVDRPREDVMANFMNKENLSLCLIRINRDNNCSVFISDHITDKTILSSKDNANVFPLYLYPDSSYSKQGKKRKPNLNPQIVADIASKLGLAFENEKSGDKDKFAPIDLLDYIYAVLHSPAYRDTYREFLKIDFPRAPYPADQDSFWRLVSLGGELRRLHLLESPVFDTIAPDPAAGKVPVEKIRYNDGKVFVNDDFCFTGVPQTAWEFYIGGYQPAQ
jgi:predicted helicase